MSAQRARSTVAAENRSAHPNVPGVPGWGAVVIAVAAAFAGFLIDAGAGHGQLTAIFATLYVIGCIAAVLAVRQSAIFTAVVQPPLILFVAVPSAYYFFHRNEIVGVKDVLINCGYPLIERFLLMFTTSVVALLIGMARWYFGAAGRAGNATPKASKAAAATPAVVAGFGTAFVSLFRRREPEDDGQTEPPRRRPRTHTVDRTASARSARRRREPTADTSARPRRARPPADADAAPSPPRRRTRRTPEDAPEPPPRRRRTPREPDPRGYRTRAHDDTEWAPRTQDAPPRRASRYADAYEPYEPYEPSYGDYSRRDPYTAPPASTHHPFSNVRYRGDADDQDEDRPYRRPR